MIKTTVTNLNIIKLKQHLEFAFESFGVKSRILQDITLMKYFSVPTNKIWTINVLVGHEKAAFANLIEQEMYIDSKILKVNYLTLVYVYPKHRGKKLVSCMIDEVERVSLEHNHSASFVIARKAIKDLYFKFGYHGFSVFPEIKLNTKSMVLEDKKNNISELEEIASAYEATYSKISGSLVRNGQYWDSINSYAEQGIINISALRLNKQFAYLIIKDSVLIEAAGDLNIMTDLVNKLAIKNFKILKSHPLGSNIISNGGNYYLRPEIKEGHLLRPFNNSENIFDKYIIKSNEISTISSKKMVMNINLLNEW